MYAMRMLSACVPLFLNFSGIISKYFSNWNRRLWMLKLKWMRVECAKVWVREKQRQRTDSSEYLHCVAHFIVSLSLKKQIGKYGTCNTTHYNTEWMRETLVRMVKCAYRWYLMILANGKLWRRVVRYCKRIFEVKLTWENFKQYPHNTWSTDSHRMRLYTLCNGCTNK